MKTKIFFLILLFLELIACKIQAPKYQIVSENKALNNKVLNNILNMGVYNSKCFDTVFDLKTGQMDSWMYCFIKYQLHDLILKNDFILNYKLTQKNLKLFRKGLLSEKFSNIYSFPNIILEKNSNFRDMGINNERSPYWFKFLNISDLYNTKYTDITKCIFNNDTNYLFTPLYNYYLYNEFNAIKPHHIYFEKRKNLNGNLKIIKVDLIAKDSINNKNPYFNMFNISVIKPEVTYYIGITQTPLFLGNRKEVFQFLYVLDTSFFNYKTTIENLSKSFASFNPEKPLSYIPFIKLCILNRYSINVATNNCISNQTSKSLFQDLTYLKSKGTKYHYYAFYSEIYKKDMLLKLNTKHPEKIKVTTYKP